MSATKDVVARDMTTGTEGADAQFADAGRLSAYVYMQTKQAAFATKAWSGINGGRQRPLTYATTAVKGPEVLTPIEEVTGISTNSVSQNSLQTIEVLAMCGDRMPA
jgi:hypothetical protein